MIATRVRRIERRAGRGTGTAFFASGCLASLICVHAAAAQDGAPAAEQDETGLEEIVVTGSRLQGVAPVGSTVSVVDRDTIVQSGATSISEMVNLVPSLSGLGFSEGSKSGQGGNNNISDISRANLRGLGPNATLTLLNGHRLPNSGSSGYGPDLNSIPDLAIERVEVLADGASAIYGSDAVAGVVNLILRRDVEGVEFTSRGGFADGYHDWKVGAIGGHRWNSGGLTLVLQQNDHSPLRGTSRSYDRQNLTSFGGSDGSQTACSPGNAVVNGNTYPVQANGTLGAAGAPNKCEPFIYNDLLGESRRTSGGFTLDQDVTETVKFSADGVFSYKKYHDDTAWSGSSISVPQTNAFFQLPPGLTLADLPFCTGSSTTKCLPMSYYIGGALGNTRPRKGYVFNNTVHASLQYDFAPQWSLRGDALLGHNRETSFLQSSDTAALNRALASSDPATAFDPFGDRTSQSVRTALANRAGRNLSKSSIEGYAATLNGSLFTLPGGDVKASVYTEYRKEHFVGRQVLGTLDAPFAVFPFDRDIKSVSGEIDIPIVSDSNAIAGIRTLDLNVAGSYDRYSDFGSTSNPKFGINWSPVPGLLFKGSYSTSFRAPGSSELVGTSGKTSTYFSTINASGATVGTLQMNGGNPDLKPETSKNHSFGLEFSPEQLPNLSLQATYFNIDYKNVISGQFNNPTVLLDPGYASLITLNPTPAQIAAVLAAFPASNAPNGATVAIIDGRPNNLGEVKVNGVDVQARYRQRTDGLGSFDFTVAGTLLGRYDVAASPTAPLVDKLDQYTYPVKTKGRGGVAWTNDGALNAGLFANYVGSYHYGTTTIESWTTVDLFAGYTFQSPGFDNDLSVRLNVTNLFDKDPPFANIPAYLFNPGGFDPQNSSAIGRLMALTVTKKF